MPDFTLCASTLCPRSKDCKRSEASGTKPGEWQSWQYFRKDGEECKSFWSIK